MKAGQLSGTTGTTVRDNGTGQHPPFRGLSRASVPASSEDSQRESWSQSVSPASSKKGPGTLISGNQGTEDLGFAPLSAQVIEDLGRILGEALVLQFQRDRASMGNSPEGVGHQRRGERYE
jgi:hypothetical protein